MIGALERLYTATFGFIQRITEDWLLGLGARLVFASVLFMYYLNSALTKVGSGFPGWFVVKDNTYAQMFPKLYENAGFDASQIAFVPYGLIAYAGTYAEFVLPVLIVLGLFTRAAAAGMIGFIAVQTFVDITGHGAEIGKFFDRVQDAAIADQRLLWVFPLVYLLLRGPGVISLDAVFGRMVREEEI